MPISVRPDLKFQDFLEQLREDPRLYPLRYCVFGSIPLFAFLIQDGLPSA
jgi:hypothetical protein